MRILYIISGLNVGGAERQLIDVCDTLSSYGHSIHIISLMGSVVLKPQSEQVKITSLSLKNTIPSLVKNIYLSQKIINKFSPEIIHSHLFHGNIFSRFLKIFNPSISLINTEHSKNIGGGIRSLLYRMTNFLVDLFTNVSDEALDNFVTNKIFPKKKSVRVYNGIKTQNYSFLQEERARIRSEYNIADNVVVFLAIGRLVEAKDYPNLLNAYNSIQSKLISELWIIGGGELSDSLSDCINELKLQSKIRLLGMKSNVREFLSASDIFVSSSAWEGFGLVIAEAVCNKKVVVATNAGGVSEVLGEHGFIVPIKNSQCLADKMLQAANLPFDKKNELCSNAYDHVSDTFNMPKICNEWLNIYRSML